MKIKQLITELRAYPSDSDVYIGVHTEIQPVIDIIQRLGENFDLVPVLCYSYNSAVVDYIQKNIAMLQNAHPDYRFTKEGVMDHLIKILELLREK